MGDNTKVQKKIKAKTYKVQTSEHIHKCHKS